MIIVPSKESKPLGLKSISGLEPELDDSESLVSEWMEYVDVIVVVCSEWE